MKKVIVITGASDGLGKAMAETLSKNNTVIILSENKEKLKKVAQEINCDYRKCDVTDYNEVEASINWIIEKYKNIDVLINNAGIWVAGDLSKTSYEDIDRCIDTNTKGTIYTTKAVLEGMYKNKSGLIINIASQASFESDPNCSVYTASKWAIRGFNRVIQKDASEYNVRVVGFYPGFMNTKLFEKAGCDYDMATSLELSKVVKAIEYVVNTDSDVIIPEIGIKSIKNY